jgi:hypothetical protein
VDLDVDVDELKWRMRPANSLAFSAAGATMERVGNVYFELTEAFNAHRPTAVLGSGQAVVYHRLAIMSKDGDWILEETPEACERVLGVLAERGARYRPGAPLDVRWLRGGWSSHLELEDERGRRVRCDFFTRPPRLPEEEVKGLFERPWPEERLLVVDVETLIRMKRTQRAKDYAVIGELARRLDPDGEIELTTDVDRILELAPSHGEGSQRPAVRAAYEGAPRERVVELLAREIDALQLRDRERLRPFQEAATVYLEAFRRLGLGRMPARQSHSRVVELAEELLPRRPQEASDADAE